MLMAAGKGPSAPAAAWSRTMAAWIHRLRFLIVALWLALAFGGLMGGQYVAYDPDVLVYFDKERPERIAFDAVETRFGQSREIVTLVVPATGDAFSPAVLRAVATVAKASAARPEVSTVRSVLSNLEITPDAALAADDETLRAAARRLRTMAAAGGRIATLIDPPGTVTAVAAIVPDLLANDPAREVAAAHRAIKEEIAADLDGIGFLQTGRIVIDDAFLTESQDDVNSYAGMQLGILAAIVFIALGSVTLTLSVMLLVLITLTGSTGVLGWSGIAINGISSAAPVVLMGLMVASAIHVAIAWQGAIAAGANKVDALATALDRNAKPILLSVATTLVSFLVLNVAEAPPFRDLGNIVAAGLLGILALTFTLLPALLTIVPRSRGRHRARLAAGVAQLGVFCVHRATIMILLTIAIAAGALAGISAIRVDDTFSHYFDKRYEIRQATDLFEERLSGTTIIDVAVDTGTADGAFDAAVRAGVADLTAWLIAQPEVARVDSLPLLVAAVTGAGGPPTADALRAASAAATREGVPSLISADGRHTRLSVVMRGVSSRDTLAFRDRARAAAAERFSADAVVVTGLPILSARLSVASARAMVTGMAIALAAISLILIVTLRDARMGLVSLVPNLLPIAVAFGLWGFLVGEVSFAATVVAALTYGIVVDDTVHLLAKYQRYRQELGSMVEAVRTAYAAVGIPVIVTSLALAASFLPFALSGFLVNRHFGALTAITLAAAMIADLVLLPAFLNLAERRRTAS
ncbi:MAG: MMPL family transporter [Pseudomonadota bacterium]